MIAPFTATIVGRAGRRPHFGHRNGVSRRCAAGRLPETASDLAKDALTEVIHITADYPGDHAPMDRGVAPVVEPDDFGAICPEEVFA